MTNEMKCYNEHEMKNIKTNAWIVKTEMKN